MAVGDCHFETATAIRMSAALTLLLGVRRRDKTLRGLVLTASALLFATTRLGSGSVGGETTATGIDPSAGAFDDCQLTMGYTIVTSSTLASTNEVLSARRGL